MRNRSLILLTALAAAPLLAVAAGANAPAPTLDELRGARYHGIGDIGAATLVNGRWEGAPFVPGGASRPFLLISENFRLVGDLDGDGADEAVVHLVSGSGGTGSVGHLAVMARREGQIVQKAIGTVGDRVQMRDARIEAGVLSLDVLQAGPNDAMCCPAQLATRKFRVRGGSLAEVQATVTGTASLATLAGQAWTLQPAQGRQSEPGATAITMTFRDGSIEGSAGCNRYTGSARQGEFATALAVGKLATTQMACPTPVLDRERQFLDALGRANSWRFEFGRLILHWGDAPASGQLVFSRQPAQ